MESIQEKNTKLYLPILIMDTYYSKKEYNDMKRSLEKKISSLVRQNTNLTNKLKKLKQQNVAD